MTTMTRLILAALAGIFLVLFAMANTHVVPISWLFGPPLEVKMITLLIIAFFAGVVTVALIGLSRKNAHRRSTRSIPFRDRLEELDLR
jgi:uncharacterized integral membrane protein